MFLSVLAHIGSCVLGTFSNFFLLIIMRDTKVLNSVSYPTTVGVEYTYTLCSHVKLKKCINCVKKIT